MKTVCETCLKAKQTRLPFGENRERAKRPLEVLHTDVCDPMEVPTWQTIYSHDAGRLYTLHDNISLEE